MSAWPLLDIPADLDDAALIKHFWDYFRRAYIENADGRHVDIRDWRGVLVIFSKFAYQHAISGHGDYRDGLGIHDVAFEPTRAERLPWIGLTLAGEAVIEVRHQERSGSRGRRLKRRVLIVTDEAYVVVLDRQDDRLLRFRTAFPADASYLTKIRREGARVGLHKPSPEKEMPQS